VNSEKTRILAQLNSFREAAPRHLWLTAGVGAASLFGMVAAFGTAPGTLDIERARAPVVEQVVPHEIAFIGASDEGFVREERVQHGDTVNALLNRMGLADDYAMQFLRTSKAAAPLFRQLSPGKSVTARLGPAGELLNLIFPLNGGRNLALKVNRTEQGYSITEQPLQLESLVVMKTAEVRSSLFGATDAAGIPDSVASGLADIFGGDIDFHRDLRKGDRLAVSYESISHLGKQVGTGRILAAEFVNGGKSYRAVWFETAVGQGGYYTPEGKNIRKAFLRSPLEFSRVTSGFASARLHPVLQKWRAHKGIDYGAPVGTRVKSTGDGIVEFVGTKGGYGKTVVVRHQGRCTTLYGHLSGFAGTVRKGSRVGQGEVIGYVGATGLASGPHLHYEFRINDVHQNPLSVALPSAPPLASDQVARFRERTQAQTARIDLIRGSNLALLD
jgi:murein DD-endopeptidase MepM/ murein hydrolase activator NlpD